MYIIPYIYECNNNVVNVDNKCKENEKSNFIVYFTWKTVVIVAIKEMYNR